jgi:hypothetical protein
MFADKRMAYVQGPLSIGFMKRLGNRPPSIAPLEKQNTHYVGKGLGRTCYGYCWMVMLEVIGTKIFFGFEKVDLGRLKMSRSRLLVILALKMPKWRMVVEFPFWRRNEIAAMGLGKHAGHFHGYGRQNRELQTRATKLMMFFDLSGQKVELVRIGARRRCCCSKRRCAEFWCFWSRKVTGG